MTNRQLRFCDEYPVDLNATLAAERSGYSSKTARAIGSRLLTNVDVKAEIERRLTARSERVGLTADEVLRELKVLALSDLTTYTIDPESGEVLAPDAQSLRALSSIKRKTRRLREGETEYEVEIKAWDKPASLRLAAQHLGMLGPKGTEDDPITQRHEVVIEIINKPRLTDG